MELDQGRQVVERGVAAFRICDLLQTQVQWETRRVKVGRPLP
jgi:hypothetical protein